MAELSKKFNRIPDFSKVSGEFPPLDKHGIAYVGHPALIAGSTGSAKSLIGRWLLLEEARAGEYVGHADMEMGSVVSKKYYEATGATAAQLQNMTFWDMPAPKMDEADEFIGDVVTLEVTRLLWDKLPDFLRTAGREENSNDAQNEWAAAFLEPLNGYCTSYVLDSTGWDGKHARGGSEKLFKVATAWVVEVLDEPRRDHIGRVKWVCVKDRFGAIGKGTAIEFSVGGDGNGRIHVSVIGTVEAPTSAVELADQKKTEREHDLRLAALIAAKKHAPDEAHAITRTQLAKSMGVRAEDQSKAIDLACAAGDAKAGLLRSKPNPNGRGVLVWWGPFVEFVSTVSQSSQSSREPLETQETQAGGLTGETSVSQSSRFPDVRGMGNREPSIRGQKASSEGEA